MEPKVAQIWRRKSPQSLGEDERHLGHDPSNFAEQSPGSFFYFALWNLTGSIAWPRGVKVGELVAP